MKRKLKSISQRLDELYGLIGKGDRLPQARMLARCIRCQANCFKVPMEYSEITIVVEVIDDGRDFWYNKTG
jgi:hypothetical protein